MKYGEIQELTFQEVKHLGLKFVYADDDILCTDYDYRSITRASDKLHRMKGNIFSTDFAVIHVVFKGTISDENEGTPTDLTNAVVITGPHYLHSVQKFSPDCDCRTWAISNRKIHELLGQYASLWSQVIVVKKRAVIELTPELRNHIKAIDEAINTRIKRASSTFDSLIVSTLLKALVLGLCVLMHDSAEDEMPKQVYGEQRQWLMQQFLNLLAEEPAKRHPVGYYAKKLGVTPKYLFTVCKEQSHQTAGKWLKYYINQQIHQLLSKSGLSIHEAALEVGFENDSFFSSYVRRNFGCTPSELRSKENKL